MHSYLSRSFLCLWAFLVTLAYSQSSAGYVGYNLTLEGDDESVIYTTANTRPNADFPDPDVYLNASVHVGTIDLEVDNLSAKINIDAQVLNLLSFNAGVDLSIDQVRLLIENVNAKVLLEARLENLVAMINTTLNSIDLNPVIAELGEGLGDIVGDLGDALGDTTSSLAARDLSFELEHNILYSTNNYRASRHTNRILAQNGDIVDQHLDNDGNDLGEVVVGNYKTDMTSRGDDYETEFESQEVTAKEYVYEPISGVMAVASIYFNVAGDLVGTQVIAETFAGGSSTIYADEDLI